MTSLQSFVKLKKCYWVLWAYFFNPVLIIRMVHVVRFIDYINLTKNKINRITTTLYLDKFFLEKKIDSGKINSSFKIDLNMWFQLSDWLYFFTRIMYSMNVKIWLIWIIKIKSKSKPIKINWTVQSNYRSKIVQSL